VTSMPDTDAGYLSIGEVLGILLEEFPDVTISKIRFLESQGLINPERTPSGYRKFYEPDVELLRVILNEQKQNYLPLRVIKDRLETGEIADPTGEHVRNGTPSGGHARPAEPPESGSDRPRVFDHLAAANDRGDVHHNANHDRADRSGADDTDDVTLGDVPAEVRAGHPAARQQSPDAVPPNTVPSARPSGRPKPAAEPQLLPGVLLDRSELRGMVGATEAELSELESFGVVVAGDSGLYDEDAVAVLRPAVEYLRAGVDARHLRTFRSAAEREASLYEQLVTPRYRQRNPEARAQAVAQLKRFDRLGGALRAALMKQALRKHFEP
jgi:DNA-binding transcriptional MerR regulator